MTKFFQTTFLFISVLFLASCSSDDNSGSATDDDNGDPNPTAQTFTLNGQTFQVTDASLQIFNDLQEGTSDTFVSVMGMNGTTVGTVSFSILYNTADGIDGIYSDDDDSWEQIPGTYSSWLSNYSIMQGQSLDNSNQPVGPLKITSHGDNVYTVEFAVEYTNNVTASGDVQKTFTVQTTSF